MFENKRIAMDITNQSIKILVGNRNKIGLYKILDTPKESFSDDKIIDSSLLAQGIKKFINKNRLKSASVDFVIRGQDIVTRIIETPIMDEKGIIKNLEYETSQFLPRSIENYYIDYEILNKVSDEKKEVYKLLVAAVPREKIDEYVELAKKLGLELNSIDIASNCISRVFRELNKKNREIESMGIIKIGRESSSIIILKNGEFFIEREVPFGMNNLYKEYAKHKDISIEEAQEVFLDNFDLNNIDIASELDVRINNYFMNVNSSFEKVIQFYYAGKTKKTLDQIYVIGEGSRIRGIESYTNKYFTSPSFVVNNAKNINIKTKIPSSCEFKLYINALGLLFRKE